MTVLTETRERFLLAIAAQVPPDRIAEIHFFAPIKQGGVESGVAVVAARRARQPEADLSDSGRHEPERSEGEGPVSVEEESSVEEVDSSAAALESPPRTKRSASSSIRRAIASRSRGQTAASGKRTSPPKRMRRS
jgi:hypothetical protein